MRKRYLAALLLLPFFVAACGPRAVDYEQISPKERLVARFSHVTAENSPKHLAAVRFASAARERTGGHVEVQVYPNSQLYKDGEEFGALQEGSIQFVAAAPSKLAQLDPAWQVFDLPYLFASFEDVERLFASQVGLQMRQRLEANGLVVLAIWPNGLKQLTNLRHPLVRPSDFQGFTFRVQAGQVLQDQFQAVGANAVVSGFSTVYADMEHHQLDGQVINDEALAKIVASRRVQVRTLSPEEREGLRTAFGPVYSAVASRLGAAYLDQVVAAVKTGH